jgi:glycerophosphoryl diester phosphodiesterase
MAAPFVVIAHRGNQAVAPELTMEAFNAALAAGFPHIELDVQLTKDSVAIVLHDEELGRAVRLPVSESSSGPQPRVADCSWDQLRELDAGSHWRAPCSGSSNAAEQDWSHCRIPTLRQVLQALKGRVHLHLVRPPAWELVICDL